MSNCFALVSLIGLILILVVGVIIRDEETGAIMA
jgi:hypothetical protein